MTRGAPIRPRGWRAPLVLVLVAVCFQAATFLVLRESAPPGMRWLGSRALNTGDQAVYLSDIEQIRSGAHGLHNLYAPEPQAPFWLFVHVPIGWLARATGWSSVAAHEVALWLCTIAGVLLLHAVSRRLTTDERDATWATALVVFGGGLGWLAPGGGVPDVATETFFFPAMRMAAHVPLSFGLLAYALRALDDDAAEDAPRRRPGGPLALGALLLIHPYFAPVVGLFGLSRLATLGLPVLRRVRPYVVLGLVALAPHVWTHVANPSRRFLLDRNDLPLAPWPLWLLALAPWLVLLAIRAARGPGLTERERWLVRWAACIALALLLPVQWKRKLTEGLGAIAVWLALPTVLALRDRVFAGRAWWAVPLVPLLASSPLFVWAAQASPIWTPASDRPSRLYAPDDCFEAWAWLRDHAPHDATVLADDLRAGIWTPAYAGRHAWIGTPHETPGYDEKRATWGRVFGESTPSQARAALVEIGADVILTTSAASTARIEGLVASDGWTRRARFGETAIFFAPLGVTAPGPRADSPK